MEIVILTTEREEESASRMGYETYRLIDIGAHNFDDKVVVRWGNRRLGYARDGRRNKEYKNVINPSKAIGRNVDKFKAIKLLAQVVNVPTIYEKSVPSGVLAVIRPFAHAAGSDFSVQRGPVKILPETYGTKFIQTNDEYRVWFCGEKTMIGRRVKMKRNEEPGPYPCRSNWGYQFLDTVPLDLHYQTLMAAKKIGLECGAADVLHSKGKWYFLELNSAASVDHRVVREFFQNSLSILVGQKFPGAQPTNREEVRREEVRPVVATPPRPAYVAPQQVRPTVARPVVVETAPVNIIKKKQSRLGLILRTVGTAITTRFKTLSFKF